MTVAGHAPLSGVLRANWMSAAVAAGCAELWLRRVRFELRRVLWALHLRLGAANLLLRPVPNASLTTLRAAVYRRVGFRIGRRVSFMSTIRISGMGAGLYERLTIGEGTFIGTDPFFSLDERITIGRNVSIGPFVRIYTSTHDIGSASARRTPDVVCKPVTIGDGVWIGVGATVLAGVTIGAGSVVGGGSVVRDDVEPNSLVSGVPAVVIRALPADG
jgi:acetyltransferase-like isoleucine patch superfamily enzyme